MLSIMLMVQAATIQWMDLDFDLRRVPPAPPDAGQDIIVAARRLPAPRYTALPELDERFLPRAQINVFGDTKLSLDVEQRIIGGVPSNRMMVSLKVAF